jgi:hypothetical protein
MYDIEATVTLTTPNELKLIANWPLRWLQAAGSIEIQRKFSPEETLLAVKGPVQHSEIAVYRGNWPDLGVGDRVIVRCFLHGESRQGNTPVLPITSGAIRGHLDSSCGSHGRSSQPDFTPCLFRWRCKNDRSCNSTLRTRKRWLLLMRLRLILFPKILH